MSPDELKEILFPFERIRDEQDKLIQTVNDCLMFRKNLVCHAPTGLGKTVAVLAPSLAHALKNGLTVFFLTSRYTQHRIAIETLRMIKEKYNADFSAVSIVGKKWMCLQPGVSSLFSSEFFEFCRKVREDNKCEFFLRLKKSNKITPEAKLLLEELHPMLPLASERIIEMCADRKICPYYLSMEIASKSRVIIGDYYYLFHPKIQETLFSKTGIELGKSIILVDEAHNLGDRLKELASEFLSSITVRRAIQESKKHSHEGMTEVLVDILDALITMSQEMRLGGERLVKKEEFTKQISKYNYEQLVSDLNSLGESIRETQKQSYIGSVGRFLEEWQKQDEGFARILSVKQGSKEPAIILSYRCLDPSVVAREIMNSSYATLLVSGTLLPTSMHSALLGMENTREISFRDPFPKKNRLNLVIPKTSTKYTERSPAQYKEIASVCADIVNLVPGNTAVFFPSYVLLESVKPYFNSLSAKTIFTEDALMEKQERTQMLESFKGYKDSGAVLLGVVSGSFGEGIDLPGDLLKCVIVVGLPLSPPDLETKSLINYFDRKFGKGWDYGYLFPAFNKCLQSAGRCIRSETDRGVIVFLDERYTWKNYSRCFPPDWEMKTSLDYKKLIWDFFKEKN